jgi:hypothetical protein
MMLVEQRLEFQKFLRVGAERLFELGRVAEPEPARPLITSAT